MSFFEKLLSITMSLGMAIPNIMSMSSTISGLFSQLRMSIMGYVAANELSILTEQKDTITTIANKAAHDAANKTLTA